MLPEAILCGRSGWQRAWLFVPMLLGGIAAALGTELGRHLRPAIGVLGDLTGHAGTGLAILGAAIAASGLLVWQKR